MLKRILLILLVSPCLLQAFPDLPAFRDAPNNVHHQGKLLWMDLFTEDVEKEVSFYTGLFGWESETLTDDFVTYTLLKNGETPIAGVVYRPASEGATVQGIWMPYLSVKNIKKTMKKVVASDGRIEVPLNEFSNRGKQVIVRDREGALLGLMESATGDPDDLPGEVGDFAWAQLFVRDIDGAVQFYTKIFGYESEQREKNKNVFAHLFKNDDKYRTSLQKISDERPNAHPSWISLVPVVNLEETLKKAKALGGVVAWGPDPEVLQGRIAYIEDPAGASLMVLEKKKEDMGDE